MGHPRFAFKKKVNLISEQMSRLAQQAETEKEVHSNVLPFSPISAPKRTSGKDWLKELKDGQKFIAGASSDTFLEEFWKVKSIEGENSHCVLLKEIGVEGNLDLSIQKWVNSELFSKRYDLQGLIEDVNK